jgi:hypothetical protein
MMCISGFNISMSASSEMSLAHVLGPLRVDDNCPGLVAVHLDRESLQVQYNAHHVLADAVNGGKLMQHAVNTNPRHRGARQARKQHPAQRVAERGTKSPLERLHDKLGVHPVFGLCSTLYIRLFDL